jgi:hypothetical protein
MNTTPDTTTAAPAATRGQDAITVLAGLWLIVGLFSDGWAHHNIPDLETFFTPWHGVLYSGFAATALWFAWLGRRGGLRWFNALPRGYGWGAAGIGVFAVGGLADMAWHLVFGVEAGLDALLSPSHLTLFVGGLLLLSSAIRSRWGAGDSRSLVALVAVALTTALVSFFLLYANEFAASAPTVPFEHLPESDPRHTAAQLPATSGLGAFLITTALLVVPLVMAWRRGRHPRGQLLVLVATLAWLATVIVDFEPAAIVGATGATLGAGIGELLLARLDRPGLPAGLRLPILAAVTALTVWAGHLLALASFDTIAWSIELTTGVVFMSALAAAALGALGTTPRVPPASIGHDEALSSRRS